MPGKYGEDLDLDDLEIDGLEEIETQQPMANNSLALEEDDEDLFDLEIDGIDEVSSDIPPIPNEEPENVEIDIDLDGGDLDESLGQTVSQTVSQPVSQPTSQPNVEPVSQSVNQTISQPHFDVHQTSNPNVDFFKQQAVKTLRTEEAVTQVTQPVSQPVEPVVSPVEEVVTQPVVTPVTPVESPVESVQAEQVTDADLESLKGLDLNNLSLANAPQSSLLGEDDFDDNGEMVFSDRDFYLSEEAYELEQKKSLAVINNKEKEIVTLADSAVYSREVLSRGIFKFPENVVSFYKNQFNKNNTGKYLRNSIVNTPSFLNLQAENEAVSMILENPNVNLASLYRSLSLDEIYKQDQAKFFVFKKWAEGIRDGQLSDMRMSGNASTITERLSNQLLDSFIPFSMNNCYKIGSKLESGLLFTFETFISDNKRLTSYVCPHCKKVNPLPDIFLVFIYNNREYQLAYDPLECSCGALCVIDKESHMKLVKSFSDVFRVIRPQNVPADQSMRSYVPTYDLLESWVSQVFKIDLNLDNLEEEKEDLMSAESYSVDWDEACREFYQFITMVGDAKFKVRSAETGSAESVKNITKVIANQSNSYSMLKEYALASLITTLADCGLSSFSLYQKTSMATLATIPNVDNATEEDLFNLATTVGLDVIRDKQVSRERFNEVLNNLKEKVNSFDSRLENYLEDLQYNKYSLSFIPVTSLSLREELSYNYLYDDRIVKVLDEISDLMILNHLSENLFKDISLTNSQGIVVKDNVSFTRAKKDLIDLNKSVNLRKYMTKILKFIYKTNTPSADSFLVDSFRDSRSINVVTSFLDACYRRDVYDINKYYPSVVECLSRNSTNTFVNKLTSCVNAMQWQENSQDKFSFYFDFDCDRSYKVKFVRLYEEKGFVPLEMKGETIEEKLSYYESLTPMVATKNFVSKELDVFLARFHSLYTYGRFVNYHNLFSDYVSYMFMRDLVFKLAYSDIHVLLKLLSLDETICSLLLEDSYELPHLNSEVIANFNLVSFPIFEAVGDTSIEGKPYMDIIEVVRNNIDTLKLNYRSFPSLVEVLEKSLGDVVEDDNSIDGGQSPHN